MREYLANLIQRSASLTQRRNLMREYVQAKTLGALQHTGAMVPLAFQGGTALRFLYGIPRYSEDLDFALEQARADYDFRGYLRAIQTEFVAEGYRIDIKANESKTVQNALIRFPGLPYELGLSAQPGEVFAVKIEVDTNPPAGAGLMTTVVRRLVPLHLHHHDPASLLAGKLHAILQRPYLKGRDVYDLLWYLSDRQWPAPNLTLLNNALQQTGWSGGQLTPETWRRAVRERLDHLSWDQVQADVSPFLEPGADARLLTPENVLRVLRYHFRANNNKGGTDPD